MQRIICTAVLSLLFGVASTAVAADTNGTNDSALQELQAQKARLDAQKDLLESRKDLLDAQQNLLKAQFPEVTAGKSGTITVGNDKTAYAIGASARVYDQIDAAARTICSSLGDVLTGKEPVITSDAEIQQAFRYAVATQELDLLLKDASALTARSEPVSSEPGVVPEALPPVASIATVLTSVASLTRLFRTDRTIHSESVTIGAPALRSAVARCFAARNVAVILPDVKVLPALLAGSKSEFMGKLHDLIEKRTDLAAIASDTANSDKARAAAALASRIDTFTSGLVAGNGGQEAPLVSILRGEVLAEAFKRDRPLLTLELSQQGGISMVTSSIWREDRLYVGGGVIVSYRLTENDRLVRSEVVQKVEPNLTRVNLSATPANQPAP